MTGFFAVPFFEVEPMSRAHTDVHRVVITSEIEVVVMLAQLGCLELVQKEGQKYDYSGRYESHTDVLGVNMLAQSDL